MSDEPKIPSRVAFNLDPVFAKEIERILSVTDLGKAPELFRRAFTLLRIHVDAALEGKEIHLVGDGEKFIVTLPFTVSA